MTNAIRVRGRRIAVRESGHGGVPCFLFHGNSGTSELFQPLQELLASSQQRVISVDLCGHGGSEPAADPRHDYSVPGLADFVREVIGAFALESCFVVGHSVGGHAVIEAMDRLPAARGIALLAAPPFSLVDLPRVFKPDPTEGALFSAQLEPNRVDAFARAMCGRNGAGFVELAASSIRATDPRFRESLGASVMAGELRDEAALAASVAVPMTLIFGDEDPFLNAEYYQQVELARPWRSGLHCLSGVGHSPHLERPDEVARILRQFFDDINARRGLETRR